MHPISHSAQITSAHTETPYLNYLLWNFNNSATIVQMRRRFVCLFWGGNECQTHTHTHRRIRTRCASWECKSKYLFLAAATRHRQNAAAGMGWDGQCQLLCCTSKRHRNMSPGPEGAARCTSVPIPMLRARLFVCTGRVQCFIEPFYDAGFPQDANSVHADTFRRLENSFIEAHSSHTFAWRKQMRVT